MEFEITKHMIVEGGFLLIVGIVSWIVGSFLGNLIGIICMKIMKKKTSSKQ